MMSSKPPFLALVAAFVGMSASGLADPTVVGTPTTPVFAPGGLGTDAKPKVGGGETDAPRGTIGMVCVDSAGAVHPWYNTAAGSAAARFSIRPAYEACVDQVLDLWEDRFIHKNATKNVLPLTEDQALDYLGGMRTVKEKMAKYHFRK